MESTAYALLLTLLAGAATGIGGMLIIFKKKLSSNFLAAALGISAGIMIYILLDELLPSAEKYGKHHVAISGVVTGMAIMGASLIPL